METTHTWAEIDLGQWRAVRLLGQTTTPSTHERMQLTLLFLKETQWAAGGQGNGGVRW